MEAPTYGQLLLLVLPVFAIVGLGALAGWLGWVEEAAEVSLLKVVVNLCMPCLIFEAVAGNPALRSVGNVLWPPLLGFGFTAAGIFASLWAGRLIGLQGGHGLRTFALTTGICNYGYLPLPIMGAIWGARSQGVLLVHNIGVDIALWTVGVLVLNGLSLRDGWRKLVNPVVVAMAATLALNYSGYADAVPASARTVTRALGACAIPLGLVLIGVMLTRYLAPARGSTPPPAPDPSALRPARFLPAAFLLRLALLPLLMLGATMLLPVSPDLKRVLIVQAAMPSAVFPIVLARLYGGQPIVAVQIALATNLAGILTIPLWMRVGFAWVGV